MGEVVRSRGRPRQVEGLGVRLFAELDQRDGKSPLFWLWGGENTGKSLLIAEYLRRHQLKALRCALGSEDREPHALFRKLSSAAGIEGARFEAAHRSDISRYTHELCGNGWCRLGAPEVIVFDDAHRALPGGLFLEVLRALLGAIPARSVVLVISREPPASALSDLQASGALRVLYSGLSTESGRHAVLAAEPDVQHIASKLRSLSLHAPADASLPSWREQASRQLRTKSGSVHASLVEALWVDAALLSGPARLVALQEELRFTEAHGSNPEASILEYAVTALARLEIADTDACRALVEVALEAASNANVPRYTALLRGLAVVAALAARDLSVAHASLSEFRACADPDNPYCLAFFHAARAWLHLLRGERAVATLQLEACLRIAREAELAHLLAWCGLLRFEIHLQDGALEAARAELETIQRLPASRESSRLQAELAFAEARLEAPEVAVQCVARAIEVMQRSGHSWLPTLLCERTALARLLGAALSAKIEPSFVRAMIRAHDLVALPPADDADDWPFPVRIFTLSRFTVLVEGEPVRFNSKAQRRPLDLLKAILAFGGRDVPEERLMDAIWPDTDADAGERALSVTLHRLRRILVAPQALERRGRALTLNPTHVWVDAWAFERALSSAQRLHGAARIDALERALRLYQRPFLPDEAAAWATLPRERLRAKGVSRLIELCSLLEREGSAAQAEALCLRALEAEPLEERLYLQLMSSFERRGKPEEAVAVYRRYRRALTALPGAPPSPEIEARYRTVVGCTTPRKAAPLTDELLGYPRAE